MNARSQYLLTFAAALAAVVPASCGPSTRPPSATAGRVVNVVAIERVYGDLAAQLGGSDVSVTSILNSPSADPHTYEPTARDADAIAKADVIVENGIGYDAFADKLAVASPDDSRAIVKVGTFLHKLGDNPHVWYEAATLRAFARVLANALVARLPAKAATIARRRDALLGWIRTLEANERAVGKRHPGASVAITEPVFDYVLHAANVRIATPPSFSHAIEEGNDPAPQDVDTMQGLLANKRVAAFVYNRQTVEPATTRLLATAKAARLAIVPVTETLPANLTTQAWIDGELAALDRAL